VLDAAGAAAHTGALLEYAWTDDVMLWGGWTQGWDSGLSDNGGDTFVGGFSLQLTEDLAFTYATSMGDFGFGYPGQAGSDSDGYAHSLLLTWELTDRWSYVAHSDYIDNDEFLGSTDHFIAVNQYLFYQYNDCWAFGARYEWNQDPRVGRNAAGEINSLTVGLNYRPIANMVIRPEVRWQDFRDENQAGLEDTALFGVDAVITY
jgi:hypothetical protein